jgi:hypothetical protein
MIKVKSHTVEAPTADKAAAALTKWCTANDRNLKNSKITPLIYVNEYGKPMHAHVVQWHESVGKSVQA